MALENGHFSKLAATSGVLAMSFDGVYYSPPPISKKESHHLSTWPW